MTQRANTLRIVEHKEPWPETPGEPCPDCENKAALRGVSVYSRAYGKPTTEHYWCDDCGIEFDVEKT